MSIRVQQSQSLREPFLLPNDCGGRVLACLLNSVHYFHAFPIGNVPFASLPKNSVEQSAGAEQANVPLMEWGQWSTGELGLWCVRDALRLLPSG